MSSTRLQHNLSGDTGGSDKGPFTGRSRLQSHYSEHKEAPLGGNPFPRCVTGRMNSQRLFTEKRLFTLGIKRGMSSSEASVVQLETQTSAGAAPPPPPLVT